MSQASRRRTSSRGDSVNSAKIAASDGRCTPGAPPGVPPEPALGVSVEVDKPDCPVVADGEGLPPGSVRA